MSVDARSRFCRGCRTWQPTGRRHSCPANDGDRTVIVPLAALRSLVLLAAELADDDDREWGEDRATTGDLADRITALGVPELLEAVPTS